MGLTGSVFAAGAAQLAVHQETQRGEQTQTVVDALVHELQKVWDGLIASQAKISVVKNKGERQFDDTEDTCDTILEGADPSARYEVADQLNISDLEHSETVLKALIEDLDAFDDFVNSKLESIFEESFVCLAK